MILSAVKPELEEATRVNEIFHLLFLRCTSFFNYQIYQYLVDQYDIKDTRDRLKYPDYLRTYTKKLNISEFIAFNRAYAPIFRVMSIPESTKLDLKFDIELTCTVAEVADLQFAIAKLLDLNVAALQLVNIDDGCVAVTFLIPTEVADILFVPNRLFSQKDVKEFRDSSVLQLECNGCSYDFSKDENKMQEIITGNYCFSYSSLCS
jgi:hypothetical protein